MKILEKSNYDFKAQLDNPERLYSIKCILLEKDSGPDELNHKIKTEHMKPLFGTTDNELAIGEYGKNELILTIVFNLDGIFFEAGYKINVVTGDIEFKMDKPMICVKDFVVPEDMDGDLAELIKEKMEAGNRLVVVDDTCFDKYYSEKFMSTFIDYVGYLEEMLVTG